MNWDDDDIPRMKRDRKLPTVLTKSEVSAILDATSNLTMIATMYSGGLRVSEVTHLHYNDISRTNKTIHICDGKSRFDRYTLLADRTLEILTEYWFKCGKPAGILFPGSWTGDYLVKDSVIQFFRESARKAGIQKHLSTHCLRHSFASHLFESGCDVRNIQALFIRRFLMHVPPKRFVRIRHYRLLSCRNKSKKMTYCRNLIGGRKYISALKDLNAAAMIKLLYNIDVCKCSSCGGEMVSPRPDTYVPSTLAQMSYS